LALKLNTHNICILKLWTVVLHAVYANNVIYYYCRLYDTVCLPVGRLLLFAAHNYHSVFLLCLTFYFFVRRFFYLFMFW